MNLNIFQMPDISQYMEYICGVQIDDEITIMLVFKQLFRDDSVLLDIYLNEISEDSVILSGRKLVKNSIVCLPNPELNFYYTIYCSDIYSNNIELNKNNVQKFYLQFTKDEDKD